MATRTTEGEWPGTLDLTALRAEGWRPTPFRQFILKIHSRCNLACDYCYVYEMADQGWREQPRRMSREVVDATARRIGEHVRAHGLTDIEVILHGGEPLLAGPDLIRHAVTAVRQEVGARARVSVGLQTNGVLLDEPFLSLFDELDVRVSVSIDGDERGHDRHRLHADGRGSHARTAAGLRRLTAEPYRHLFTGLLATIDLANPPVETYEALLEFRPPAIDFLLPHGNWDTPPPGRVPDSLDAPYGEWLTAVFDRWTSAPRRETRVRLFRDIIALSLDRPSASEAVGLSPAAMVVIETDGTIEQVDTLKSAYEGAAATGLHVGRDGFDVALALPSTAARQIGLDALSATCRACPVGEICGGGQYVHRYRTGSGFRNPSVYCRDLFRLASHVRDAVARDVARTKGEVARGGGVRPRSEPARPELTRLSIPEKVFTGLAQGAGGGYAVDELWRIQRSKRLLLLRWVREAAKNRDPGREARARQAYALLADIQMRAPDAVRAVLDHPAVGVWAHAVAAGDADTDPITALAAAAAIRARDPRPIEVVGDPDGLFLPSLGTAAPFAGTGVVSAAPGAPVTIASDAGTATLPADDPHHDAPGWRALRGLEAEYHGMGLRLLLDDCDPLRSVGGAVAPRLTPEEAEQWRGLLRGAWRLLVRWHWTIAEEAARALRVLTPLVPPSQGMRSATVNEAFGTVYASMPPDERDMAVTFAHEVQHAKLGALNDAIPLTRPDDGRRYYAPWRDDPRPAAGLLTGAYAHLGVAGFWRRQRHHEHGDAAALRAHSEFAHWRDAAALVTGTLLRSGGLTDDGQRFVAEMDRTLRSWRREPVPSVALDVARTTATRHRERWRAEHGDPTPRP